MKGWLGLYAVLAYAFLHVPMVVLGVFSFNASRYSEWEGFTLAWYRAALGDGQLMEGALNSLWIGLGATVIATMVGTLCAYGLWKRGSLAVEGVLYLSLVTPEIVMGIALLALFQFLFRHLDLRLGIHTVILAHVMFCTAYVVTVVAARLRGMDASLEEAAMDLGASEWEAFTRVTLPQLRPAIAAAGLLVFITSFDDFVITSLVAGVDSETLPMVIYAMARKGFNPAVNAISTMIVAGLGVLILVSSRLEERG